MSSESLVAIVTGANRGIGQAICQLLSQSQSPIIVYAASRAGEDLGFSSSEHVSFKYPRLDITDAASVKSLASSVKSSHHGLDVLINNAGYDTSRDENGRRPIQAKMQIVDVNFRGTLQMYRTFLPIMNKNGRIVNLSSVASSLSLYSKDIQKRFRNPDMTWADLDELVAEWEAVAKQDTEQQNGWPSGAYSASKAFINAMTAISARENPEIAINACCPGWVATDMGSIAGHPPKSPVEGAKIPFHLGFKDIGGVTGRYWANDSISSTAEGKVQEW